MRVAEAAASAASAAAPRGCLAFWAPEVLPLLLALVEARTPSPRGEGAAEEEEEFCRIALRSKSCLSTLCRKPEVEHPNR